MDSIITVGNGSDPSTGASENMRSANIATLSIIFAMTIFGNFSVILVLFRRSRKKALFQMQWLIIHLSIADILVGFCNALPRLLWDYWTRFSGTDFQCKMVKFGMVAVMYGSTYVMTVLAIDRYLSLFHSSFRHRSKAWSGKFSVLFAWSLAIVFSLPQFFIFSQTKIPGQGEEEFDCCGHFEPSWLEKLYTTWSCSAIFFLPMLILLYCYGRIFVLVRRFSISTRKKPNSEETKRTSAAHRIVINRKPSFKRRNSQIVTGAWLKTMKLSLTIVVCYIICWTPFVFIQMWAVFDNNVPDSMPLSVVMMRLASLNSCTNPWIYLVFLRIWRTTENTVELANHGRTQVVELLNMNKHHKGRSHVKV